MEQMDSKWNVRRLFVSSWWYIKGWTPVQMEMRQEFRGGGKTWVKAKFGMDGEPISVWRGNEESRLVREKSRWKSQEWWSISSPEVARREERSKELKNAEARPVAWRRGEDWTAVLHITSASPTQVNLVMVDISIAIKLRNIQKCDETRFLWWFSQCNEARPMSHLFRSSFFSLTKTFLVNCNMSFHDAALQLVVKGF